MKLAKLYSKKNSNCAIPSGTSTSAFSWAVEKRLSGGPWTWRWMSTFKYKKLTPENVNYCVDCLSYFRSPYKLKFFDEAGFALASVGKANYGYSLAYHPCVEISKHLCFPNATLNMLVGLRGNLYANRGDGATDTLAFWNFFGEANQTVNLSYNTAIIWFETTVQPTILKEAMP